jgi:shikimate kinase
MSIILIGMPSCGKSTLGVLLAKKLGYRFVDSDLLIQEREGRLLHEIIAEEGNDGFLAIENEVNSAIEEKNTIIATGGSVVYCEEAMEHLKTLGKVVYLKIPFDEMRRRLGDFSHRGVTMRHGNSLEDMFGERELLYEKYADLTVDVCNAQLSDSLEQICKSI